MEMKGKDFVVGLLLGGVIGAGIALLLAPQSGEETREWLRENVDELGDRVREGTRNISDNMRGMVEQGKTQVSGMMRRGQTPAGAGQAEEA